MTQPSDASPSLTPSAEQAKSLRPDTSLFGALLAVLAVIALGFAWAALRNSAAQVVTPTESIAHATLLRMDHAVFRGMERVPKTGDTFGNDTMMLVRGRAELQMQSGTRIVLEAPAEFSLTSDNSIRINRGKFAATVPPEATGFTISTFTADIVDLGTQVGGFFNKGGNMQITTTEGKVEIIPRDGSPRMLLEAGESAMLTNTGLEKVAYNPAIFTFTLED